MPVFSFQYFAKAALFIWGFIEPCLAKADFTYGKIYSQNLYLFQLLDDAAVLFTVLVVADACQEDVAFIAF